MTRVTYSPPGGVEDVEEIIIELDAAVDIQCFTVRDLFIEACCETGIITLVLFACFKCPKY